MSRITIFFTGVFTGAYIAQNYDIPKVTETIRTITTIISHYEKKK